jgi:hypothetical protein
MHECLFKRRPERIFPIIILQISKTIPNLLETCRDLSLEESQDRREP